MNCRLAQALLFLASSALCSPAIGELITYKLINEAAGDQNGYTLEGTITLDPDCAAACTALDSWEWTVSGPTGVTTRTSRPTGISELMINPSGLFVASPTELTIDFDASTMADELILDLAGVAWSTNFFSGGAYETTNLVGWSTNASGRVVIATAVPEPNAFLCLALIGVAYFAAARTRLFARNANNVAEVKHR